MAILSITKQIKFLNSLGLPAKTLAQRRASWKVFQDASAWHHFDAASKKVGPLTADGVPGPKTIVHVNASTRAGYRIAPHFKLSEFKCRAAGHTHVSIWRELVYSLELLRSRIGPINIVNGYRCPAFNKQVGGVPNSAHIMWPGRAVDFQPHPAPIKAKGLGFHGIGVRNTDGNPRTPMVTIHVDQHPSLRKDTVFTDA